MSELIGYAVPLEWLPWWDHTYVKTYDSTYCWKCYGRCQGGKPICSGKGNAEAANCISQPDSTAGMQYLFDGVCHQMANRILYPTYPQVHVAKARGYNLTNFKYGTFGIPRSIPGFKERLKSCGIKGETNPAKTVVNRITNGSAIPADREQIYHQKIADIYKDLLNNDKNLSILKEELNSIPGKELKLMMEFSFGRVVDPEIFNPVLKQQSEFLRETSKIDRSFLGDDISIERWAQEGNELFTGALKQTAEIIGKDQFEILFGISPPKSTFIFIDPDIAARTDHA